MSTAAWTLLFSLIALARVLNAYGFQKVPLLAAIPSTGAAEYPLRDLFGWAVFGSWLQTNGGFDGWLGGIAALVLLGSCAGLFGLQARSRRTEDVVELALRSALGEGYESHLAPNLPRPELRVPLHKARLYEVAGRRRFCRDRDISFGEHGKSNLLDVWRHPNMPRDAAAPVLLHVHGGGWRTGSKTFGGQPLMTRLAKRGWVCVSINYRLLPKDRWPAQIIDVKAAIAWIRQNIAEYGGDPDFIAVTGGSAGGHLTAVTALTPNEPRFQPGFEHVDTTVQAAVPCYGVFNFTSGTRNGQTWNRWMTNHLLGMPREEDPELWTSAEPIRLVGPHAPPFMVVHGTIDSLTRVEPARGFVAALRGVTQRPVAFVELPSTQHAFDLRPSLRTLIVNRGIEIFLSAAYAEHQQRRRTSGTPASGTPGVDRGVDLAEAQPATSLQLR